MLKSLGRTLVRVLLIITPVAGVSFFNAGCSNEMLTYAAKSRAKGLEYYSQRSYEEATGAFRNAIKQDPRDYESQYWLGVCYTETGQHRQAYTQYRAALDVMSSTFGARSEHEFRLKVIETYADAIARHDVSDVELTGAEDRAGRTRKAEDWLIVAKAYRAKGDVDKAIESYTRASRLDTGNFAIRKDYGLYLLQTVNQRAEAEQELRAAYRLDPNDTQVIAALQQLGVPVQMPKWSTGKAPERTAQAPRD